MVETETVQKEQERIVGEKVQILNRTDFIYDDKDEPHFKRTQEILKAHPEIKNLFGPDPNTIWVTLFYVSIQLFTMYWVRNQPWYIFLAAAYFVGGTLNNSLTLAVHEITHGLAFHKSEYNILFSFIANLPLGLPFAVTFKKYHLDHHHYQGIYPIDTDIASYMEATYINSRSRLLKFINVIFLVVPYAVRPMIVNPKFPGKWEIVNFVTQFSFNYFVYKYLGIWAIIYLLLGTFLGLGIHPMAGHFIQEHFVRNENKQETYSYYGPLNFLMFNVGYHNEHHDFPRIPGSRLPLVRKIAPEFYDHLDHYDSLTKVLYDYVMTDGWGHFNRVRRTKEARDRAMKEHRKSKQA